MTTIPTLATRTHAREAAQALAAELSKLLSLPATWLTLGGTLAVNLILATAFTIAGLQGSTGTKSALDIGLASISYAQAGFVILGVLAACSEYTGGQIRTTLTAMPRRALQLSAKHLALAIVVLPAAAITAASGVVLTAAALGDAAVPVTSGHVAAALSGVTAYLALTTLISAAVGALVRQTLAAVVILLGYFFIVGPLLRDHTPAAKYLPDSAGFAMWFPVADNASAVTPAQGALLLTAWTIVLIAVALLGYRRRDS
ncbi:ABC transporter permease [Planotetraspora sp. A-T 1434]|uniref:ABC transporter permease n=1 Tax=Planotetraspora sp. A-T 1434 TaxID=2979219 RepID=UPI0021C1CE07|nr:ABC transporter permease [Planotetraspora sp. A-T 1434]MCT9929919.1 ABC transporter permease [Planotetraspora sp. A-T 1434]